MAKYSKTVTNTVTAMLGGGGEEEEVPHSFMCPILLEVMRDPHVLR